MNVSLKLIKIQGHLNNLNNYTEDVNLGFRLYKTVTIVDKDGDEIYFESLLIPARNDEEVRNGQQLTFYILRSKRKNQLIGALFAVNHGNEKRYYKLQANNAMSLVARLSTKRGRLMIYPPVFMAVFFFVNFSVLMFAVLLATIIGSKAAHLFMYIFFAGSIYWSLLPLFNSKSSFINEAEEMLKGDGFNLNNNEKSQHMAVDKY